MTMMKVVFGLVAVLLGLLVAAPAHAQGAGGVYWQCIAPPANPTWCPVSPQYPMPVTAGEANTIATGQVSVGATATQIAPARVGRNSITITNTGTTAVYVGAAGVTTTTGALLPGTTGASLTLDTQSAVYGVVATGTESVTKVEVY